MSTTPLYPANKQPLGVRFRRAMTRWWPLYLMLLPGIIYFLVYKYAPMYGLVIAFKKFSIKKGILGSPWVTPWYKYFEQFFSSPANRNVIKNTITLSLWKLAVGLFPSLIFALAVSECRNRFFARIVQTISYLPHFLSWVVVYGICVAMLSQSNGVVNTFIKKMGGTAIPFMTSNKYFQAVLVGTDLWKALGWGAIIYLAAIMGIDTSLYEAATVDGCGRFRQIWYITLPCILPTIMTMLILRMGSIFTVGYEKIMLMYNPATYETADVISTYVYRRAFEGGEYSFSAAVGLFNSVINFIVIIVFNKISKRVSEVSLW